MYTIEYYKNQRTKPIIEEPNYPDNPRLKNIMKRRYLHKKDVLDKCFNIKSLTIDLEDINNIIFDKKVGYLLGLYMRVKKSNISDDINSITILNSNKINESCIYEIINCDWMVNKDDEINILEVLKMARQLYTLTEEYEKANDLTSKNHIKKKMYLIKYYIDTIINKCCTEEEKNVISLKLGKKIIEKKNNN